LLYYFPKEAGPIVAKRLRELDVSSGKPSGRQPDSDANGVPTDELLKAVAFSDHKDSGVRC